MTALALANFALSLPGGRPVNEDSYGCASHGKTGYCFAVADGLGGLGQGPHPGRMG